MLIGKTIPAALICFLFIGLTTAQTSRDSPNRTPGAYWNSKECKWVKPLYESAALLLNYTREDALREAALIKRDFPGWYEHLPCCPENIKEISESYWEKSNTNIECFHPSSSNCYRSVHRYASDKFEETELAAGHGQQCCYDRLGNLIKSGPGAGTPDFVSPEQDIIEHQKKDVLPWIRLSLNEYHSAWYPNQGCGNPFKVFVAGDVDWTPTALYVKQGDIISFYNARGTVVWGQGGSSCGPEGSKHVAESTIGFLLAPPKLLGAPTGGLIGMIYAAQPPPTDDFILYTKYISKPLFIGRGTQVSILADGFLFLGVNDGFPANNSGYFQVTIKRIRR
ncbi:MAG: hypothetical protein L0229_27545 [Blastocatellia bacterium]|nr:hypothetical protein [Blastocatellia bacterium]